MSAFVVSKEHIDAMVSLTLTGPSGNSGYWPQPFSYYAGEGRTLAEWQEIHREIRLEDADELGQMLWGTNALSVRTRYPDLYDGGEYPGPVGFKIDDVYEYRYKRPRRRPTTVEGFKLLDCFEYQSCEFDTWKQHAAYHFCCTLRNHLVSCLPGYAEAPWEWTDAAILA